MIMQLFHRARVVAKTLTNRELDAVDMLERDHIQVEVLFLRLKMAKKRAQKLEIFEKIRNELELHMEMEETHFYPACQDHDELKSLVKESFEEHAEVKTLMKEISVAGKNGGKINAKINKLIKNIEHHVSEEENELFPASRRLLPTTDLRDMAREYRGMRKREKTEKAA